VSAGAADREVDVAVVGGGVAGLAVAHDLARGGLRVELIERAAETGGLLCRGELDGRAIDVGAESFAVRTTGVADLIADAALPLTIVDPSPAGAHVATLDDAGRVLRAALPQRTVLGIPADPAAADVVAVLGEAGARRATAERDGGFDPASAAATEPSLADLVSERLGSALVDRLVDPLCRSVYSAPAASLRLSRAHPAMWREFRARGSLLEAASAVASPLRAGAAVGGIHGGMWRLADALTSAAQEHGVRVRTETAVHALRPVGGGVDVVTDGGTLRSRRVVLATGPSATESLIGLASATATAPAVRVVAARIESARLDAMPVGSGVIVAAGVPSAAKALTHVTVKWEWAASAWGPGVHVVRLSARDASADGLSTEVDIAREVTLLTGIRVEPAAVTAVASSVWTDAVAATPIVSSRQEALARQGVVLAGATVAGTGLASVVPHARQVARDLLAELAAPVR
jgi:oxygen-dependent protoporphyrinogen oxidase